jgi:uncharacterized protein YdeI (YjbR/CyaY-like superfamily)
MSEVLACRDGAAWEAWLADHHTRQAGVWLRIARNGSWYLQRYTPRWPQGTWSKVNVDKVEALTAAGRMRAPGMAEVEAAKADGRWDAAYEPARTATVPPDLAAALAQDERARRRYESLSRTDRYLVILRLQTARTPEARAARLRRMVATLAAGDPVR